MFHVVFHQVDRDGKVSFGSMELALPLGQSGNSIMRKNLDAYVDWDYPQAAPCPNHPGRDRDMAGRPAAVPSGFALDSRAMSKAFTKESDGEDDDERDLAADAGMPGGFTNYITPAGRRRLNDELTRLWKVDRPQLVETIAWAASNGDRSENGDYIYGKRKLREIDRRIRFLSKRLDSAVVVDNAGKDHDRVYFGATVTVVDEAGAERTVSIVGVDELDPAARARVVDLPHRHGPAQGARSATSSRCGRPRGTEELEIVAIRYETLS